jgi:hypothetical protein
MALADLHQVMHHQGQFAAALVDCPERTAQHLAPSGHAHKQLQQVIIAISGSFDVELDDGVQKKTFHLRRSNEGLYLSNMIWRELTNFSSGSVGLVLASRHYEEDDYYRDYGAFQAAAGLPRG